MKGWICLHRGVVDHWIYQEPEALKLWITMLIEANHENKKHMFNGAMIEINKGQLVCGRISLAGKTGISENKIRRYLDLLESDSMIHQQKTNKCSIITIVNYAQYQEKHQQTTIKKNENDGKTPSKTTSKTPAEDIDSIGESAVEGNKTTSKEPANHQQTTTPKQLNNTRINKQHEGFDFSSWPELPEKQIADDWFAMRKRIKADVSQTVINSYGKQMVIAVRSGSTVDDCLSVCITSNWRGFQYSWIKNQEQAHAGSNKHPRPVQDKTQLAADAAFGPDPGTHTILEGSFDRIDANETSY